MQTRLSSGNAAFDGSGVSPGTAGWRRIRRAQLVNSLNHLHFQDGDVTLTFRHPRRKKPLILHARPQPCLDDRLECRWAGGTAPRDDLWAHRFEHFSFSDGLQQVIVEASLLKIDEEGVLLSLPETGYDVSTRSIRRHPCDGVEVRLSQGGAVLRGSLVSFSAASFSLAVEEGAEALLSSLDHARTLDVTLAREGKVVFSGPCLAVGRPGMRPGRLALRPQMTQIRAQRPRTFRSSREDTSPLPNIIFRHPLSGQMVRRRARDVSGIGFSLEEARTGAVLFPGLVIDDVAIEFIEGFAIRCRAQVLYNNPLDEETHRCGLAVLDMDARDHLRLHAFLQQSRERHIYIGTSVLDLDALWNFFFETGFIYPKKYAFIHGQKEDFKALYRRLYTGDPGIARHVLYQEKGRIVGHVSMYRYYRLTWMMHHHAAVKSSRLRAGLAVMRHILHYVYEFQYLHPELMQFIAAYYRPDNRFAERTFGGAARALGDRRACSVDRFAYLLCRGDDPSPGALPEGWSLTPVGTADLEALRDDYGRLSGGLAVEGLDLLPGAGGDVEISRAYRRLGFRRERRLTALREGDALRAVFVVNLSDVGLNMSDLANCIQAFVIDREGLSPEVLHRVLGLLATAYGQPRVPALVHPLSWADERGITYDKAYDLTVLDLEHIGPYLEFMEALVSPHRRRMAAPP